MITPKPQKLTASAVIAQFTRRRKPLTARELRRLKAAAAAARPTLAPRQP